MPVIDSLYLITLTISKTTHCYVKIRGSIRHGCPEFSFNAVKIIIRELNGNIKASINAYKCTSSQCHRERIVTIMKSEAARDKSVSFNRLTEGQDQSTIIHIQIKSIKYSSTVIFNYILCLNTSHCAASNTITSNIPDCIRLKTQPSIVPPIS